MILKGLTSNTKFSIQTAISPKASIARMLTMLLPPLEQHETTSAINYRVVFEPNSGFRAYCVRADFKGRIDVGAVAKDPNRHRPTPQSGQPKKVSVMRVAEKH
jgi:hypothetical protein